MHEIVLLTRDPINKEQDAACTDILYFNDRQQVQEDLQERHRWRQYKGHHSHVEKPATTVCSKTLCNVNQRYSQNICIKDKILRDGHDSVLQGYEL